MLIFLPLKYIYDRQQSTVLITENGTSRSVTLESERDKMLIQPIVSKMLFSDTRIFQIIIYLDPWC